MYKEASKQKLTVLTDRGLLRPDQLWDLSVGELDNLAVKLEEEYKNSKGKSFIEKKTEKDKTIKIKFDIVLDILTTKLEEAEIIATASENRSHNKKIIELIAEKKEGELKNKSVTELEAMLK